MRSFCINYETLNSLSLVVKLEDEHKYTFVKFASVGNSVSFSSNIIMDLLKYLYASF